MSHKNLHWAVGILCWTMVISGSDDSLDVETEQLNNVIKKNNRTKPTNFIIDLIHDLGALYKNFIDWDTYKTVVTTFPFYAGASMLDKTIHHQFYDFRFHCHEKQMPEGLIFFAENIAIPLEAGMASGMFLFAKEKRLRETSKMFLLGLPFVVFTCDLIKVVFKSECCYRPLHEKFCKDHKRCFGGFPSAHAAQVAYAAGLYGMQFGLPAAVPLSIVGVLVCAAFINDNRHYTSQIVAGAGLGVMYALAASKIVDQKFKNFNFKLSFMSHGKPALGLAYNF